MSDEKKKPGVPGAFDDSVPEQTPAALQKDLQLDRRQRIPGFAELQSQLKARSQSAQPPGVEIPAPLAKTQPMAKSPLSYGGLPPNAPVPPDTQPGFEKTQPFAEYPAPPGEPTPGIPGLPVPPGLQTRGSQPAARVGAPPSGPAGARPLSPGAPARPVFASSQPQPNRAPPAAAPQPVRAPASHDVTQRAPMPMGPEPVARTAAAASASSAAQAFAAAGQRQAAPTQPGAPFAAAPRPAGPATIPVALASPDGRLPPPPPGTSSSPHDPAAERARAQALAGLSRPAQTTGEAQARVAPPAPGAKPNVRAAPPPPGRPAELFPETGRAPGVGVKPDDSTLPHDPPIDLSLGTGTSQTFPSLKPTQRTQQLDDLAYTQPAGARPSLDSKPGMPQMISLSDMPPVEHDVSPSERASAGASLLGHTLAVTQPGAESPLVLPPRQAQLQPVANTPNTPLEPVPAVAPATDEEPALKAHPSQAAPETAEPSGEALPLDPAEVLARPAALWRRLGAFLVDLSVVAAAGALYLFVAAGIAQKSSHTTTGFDALIHQVAAMGKVLLPGVALVALVAVIYSTLFAFLARGRTLGRALLGVRLVDGSGQPPGPGRALLRSGLSLLSFALFLSGFWLALFDRKGQTLHDKLTQTFVVRPL